MMDDTQTILVNKQLLNYAFLQNGIIAKKIASQLAILAAITGYIVFSGIWLSSEATKQELLDPLFTGPRGAAFYKPTVNPSIPLTSAYDFAQSWAEQLSSLHFNRLEEQLQASSRLFYPGIFERDYLVPLRKSAVFEAVQNGNLIITAAGVKTQLINKVLQEDGLIVYLFTVRLLQTTVGLSGTPSTAQSTFYISLVEVDRATAIEGLQIYKTQISRG